MSCFVHRSRLRSCATRSNPSKGRRSRRQRRVWRACAARSTRITSSACVGSRPNSRVSPDASPRYVYFYSRVTNLLATGMAITKTKTEATSPGTTSRHPRVPGSTMSRTTGARCSSRPCGSRRRSPSSKRRRGLGGSIQKTSQRMSSMRSVRTVCSNASGVWTGGRCGCTCCGRRGWGRGAVDW